MKVKSAIIVSFFILVLAPSMMAQKKNEKKELTRKEHLDLMTKHYFSCSDHLWDFISHVANGESIARLDKKRRGVAKFFYEEKKKLEEIGDYNGDKVIYNGMMTYIDDVTKIIQEDYKELVPHEEAAVNSPALRKVYYDELMKVDEKLSMVTNRFVQIDLSYRVKYFSFKRFVGKKTGKAEKIEKIPENKILTILKVYKSFSPLNIAFKESKLLEDSLYEYFQARDTIKCRDLIEKLKSRTTDNRFVIESTPIYLKDTSYHQEYEKMLDHHDELVTNVMPAMLSSYQRQLVFNKEQQEFASKKNEATAEDYDAMDIKVREINDSNDKFNVMFNNYIDDRNELYNHFDYVSRHFRSVHIVREK